jgi:hypothetical protein
VQPPTGAAKTWRAILFVTILPSTVAVKRAWLASSKDNVDDPTAIAATCAGLQGFASNDGPLAR